MFITVYVDLETFHESIMNHLDFEATLTQGKHEVITLSVPIEAIYLTGDEEMVSVKQEILRRYRDR